MYVHVCACLPGCQCQVAHRKSDVNRLQYRPTIIIYLTSIDFLYKLTTTDKRCATAITTKLWQVLRFFLPRWNAHYTHSHTHAYTNCHNQQQHQYYSIDTYTRTHVYTYICILAHAYNCNTHIHMHIHTLARSCYTIAPYMFFHRLFLHKRKN